MKTKSIESNRPQTPTYTPGPWSVKTGNGEISIIGRYVFPPGYPAMGGYPLVAVMSKGDTCPADSALIAAAPDLLRELSHLVRLMEPKEKECGLDIPGLATLNGARAAIAKASQKEREIG